MAARMYKIDLHSHSIISHDGGITKDEYKTLLEKGIIDMVAITDHDDISFAQSMQKELGNAIIVGEEITTSDGEIIGLFLQEKIPAGMTGEETAKRIREQGGLVYIPHPFETGRQGMHIEALEKVSRFIAIMEVYNGRGLLRGMPRDADAFATSHAFAKAASSDAHSQSGVGCAYTNLVAMPTRTTLVPLLREGTLVKRIAPFFSLLSPTINRIKKKLLS